MTLYHREIIRIRDTHYSNKGQLQTVIGARHYINEHLDEEVNLGLLAQVRFTSKFHLLRLFKRYYGQTPKEHLTDKRMEKAKDLLKKGTSVMETCFAVGFESPSSFSTLFKSRTALTPTEFQKEQLSQRQLPDDLAALQS